MKRLLLCFILCLSIAPLFSIPASQDYQEIPIKGGEASDHPRQLFEVPIAAYYYGSAIYVSFSENIGNVDVTVEDLSEGIMLQTVLDSSLGTAIIPFNASNGEYLITFSLSSGSLYYGSLSL